jgi:hypothetical protein
MYHTSHIKTVHTVKESRNRSKDLARMMLESSTNSLLQQPAAANIFPLSTCICFDTLCLLLQQCWQSTSGQKAIHLTVSGCHAISSRVTNKEYQACCGQRHQDWQTAHTQVLGRNLEGVVNRAMELKSKYGDSFVSIEHLMLALYDDPRFGSQLFKSEGITSSKLDEVGDGSAAQVVAVMCEFSVVQHCLLGRERG